MVLASLAIAPSTAYADDVDTSSLQKEVKQLRQEVQRLNEEVKFLKETVVPVPPTAKQAEAVAQPPAQSNPTELPSASAGARPAGDSGVLRRQGRFQILQRRRAPCGGNCYRGPEREPLLHPYLRPIIGITPAITARQHGRVRAARR